MKNNTGFSNEQVSKMLAMVAEKMGKTPQQLEQELKNGKYPTDQVNEFVKNNDISKVMENKNIKDLLGK